MSARPWRRLLVVVALLGALAALPSTAARAQGTSDAAGSDVTPGYIVGPTLTVNPASAAIGQSVDVIFSDWNARLATLSICGNEARRGASDCNQVGSQGVTIRGLGVDVPIATMAVNAPPVPCPCVVKAVGTDTHESAIVPLDIPGFPTAPLTDPPGGKLIEAEVIPQEASAGVGGALRSAMGGETAYDVVVSVRNTTTEQLDNVRVFGSVGHTASEQLETFQLTPGPIDGGRTWTTTVRVVLPAPAWGSYVWTVDASGAGPTVTAEAGTRLVPWLLFVLIALLVGVIVMILLRWRDRRRQRRAPSELPPGDRPSGALESAPADDDHAGAGHLVASGASST